MRDAVAAEDLGLPAVVVVFAALTNLGRETLLLAGLPDLRLVSLNATLFGMSREEIAGVAATVAPHVAAGLMPIGHE